MKKSVILIPIIFLLLLIILFNNKTNPKPEAFSTENTNDVSENETLSGNSGSQGYRIPKAINLLDIMYIPDPEEAQYPELTQSQDKLYWEPSRVYTEKEKEELVMHTEAPAELVSISSPDVSESLLVDFNVVTDGKYYHVTREAYKQEDCNLYIGNLMCSLRNDKDRVIGKFIVSYQGDKLVISIQYYNQERDKEKGAYLKEGVHYYESYTTLTEEELIEKAGITVKKEDYSSYCGKWFEEAIANPPDDCASYHHSYVDLNISSKGELSGILRSNTGKKYYGHGEFSGFIEDGIGYAEYADDGHGNTGSLTFTFYENGIILYVNKCDASNYYGFSNGTYYYFR